ncbi:MAG: hypothetical protein A2W93_14390 [Bacteroidetes bacterium GWF2_43_63]|nr:MAG: hypothetical protein A2W94_00960 [Bacteroidetes bacterium GWE2_42_42]OFY52530.1 MAG: hypothetical protein A2W93_14390 [Bacteroidetes bacterium GWF2_43_63]
MIKPEFWISEDITSCTLAARLLFVGLWNFCDDNGVHPHATKTIKMEIFPGDNMSFEEIETYIQELVDNDLVVIYKAQGKEYLKVKNWDKHQRIDRPKCRYPNIDKADIETPEQAPVKKVVPAETKDPIKEDACETYISYINSRLGCRFQKTNKVMAQFNARIKDGFTGADFEKAFENAVADEFHRKNNFKYLTPEFFTRPDILQKWLNAKIVVPMEAAEFDAER